MTYLHLSLYAALILGASSCGTVRTLPVQDSSRAEVRVERTVRIDTVFVQLPEVAERVTVLDTVSVLENQYAKSEAVVSGGRLSHSLELKPARVPVMVPAETVVRDSLVWRDRVVEKEVERQLSSWERVKMGVGGYACVLLVVLLILSVIQFITNLKSFKL